MALAPSQFWSINDWADYWRYQIGVNVIPADTRNKIPLVKWTPYQNIPIVEEQHNQWKQESAFAKGIAIIVGKVWHNDDKNGLYLTFVDLDNKKAIDEFCTRDGKTVLLDDMAKHMIIEQHRDEPNKAHAYFYSRHPFKKKSSGPISNDLKRIDIPAIEVKGLGEHGLAFCSPSPHKNGHNYENIGTPDPEIIDDLELHIDNICGKYNIPYLNGNQFGNYLLPINELFKPEMKILEGHNRHEGLLRIMESLLRRNQRIMNLNQIRNIALTWNNEHCVPPLDETEFERQWIDAVHFIDRVTADEAQKSNSSNDGDKENVNEEEIKPQTNAGLLIELATRETKLFFNDKYGKAFALVKMVDHNEVIAVDSNRFKRYLAKLFYDNYKKSVVSTDAINNSIQVLQAKAEYESQTIPLSLRVASPNEECIYYDLTDEKWRCVRITSDGWQIVNDSPVLFVRYNQIPQIEPDRAYGLDVFDKFLNLTNVKDEVSRLLLKVYIVSLFIPQIAHAILLIHGEKGSAKSTLQTLIKILVDPSKPTLLTVHKDRNEFIQQCWQNHVVFYDNLKRTPDWLSDEACKTVTGVGSSKRKLFTDDETIVYEYKRCLGFNGINIMLTEPDALDRSLMIEQERIPRESRRLESEIFAEFEAMKPGLLGYIFDVLVKAQQIRDAIKLDNLPRMADFALWGEAIARAMGHEPLEFINAYYENIGKQNIEAIEYNPLGQAIVKLCEKIDEFYGSMTECLDGLNVIAGENNINTDSKSWPKSSTWLSRYVNKIRSNLLEGPKIEIVIRRLTADESHYKKGTATIKIRKIE